MCRENSAEELSVCKLILLYLNKLTLPCVFFPPPVVFMWTDYPLLIVSPNITISFHTHTHTHTNNPNTLWSPCVTEQVPVSWLLLPFPCCNTIPMLLCVHVVYFCVFVLPHIVWFQWVVCMYAYVQVCYFMCVWSRRRATMARWQTHQAEVKGLCSHRTVQAPVSSYHNRYIGQSPRANLHPSTAGKTAQYSSYRWARGWRGVSLNPGDFF